MGIAVAEIKKCCLDSFLPTNKHSVMEIVYVYQKKRSEFGKQPLLSDRLGEVSLSIPPDPAYMKNYTERNPTHTEVQATPDKSEHEVPKRLFAF